MRLQVRRVSRDSWGSTPAAKWILPAGGTGCEDVSAFVNGVVCGFPRLGCHDAFCIDDVGSCVAVEQKLPTLLIEARPWFGVRLHYANRDLIDQEEHAHLVVDMQQN